MPNGKPHDNPITDTVVHGLHPFPAELEELIRVVHERNPDVFNDLEWAPFDWEKGDFITEAMTLLNGLVENHGDLAKCREILNQYHTATKGDV